MKPAIRNALLAVAPAVLLAACGGGGSSGGGTPATSYAVSGTAAAGAPITPSMNGVVTLKDSSIPAKLITTTTDANGHYAYTTAQLAGATGPYMLEIAYQVGGVSYYLHSAVTSQDISSGNATINITPLTNLVIANLGHDIARNVFTNGNYSSILTPTALAAGVAALDAQLQPLLTQQGVSATVDLLHQSFSANGSGLDALLDTLKVVEDPVARTATLVNLTNNSTVVDDLTINAGSNTGQVQSSTTPLTDLQAITNTFHAFGALLATSPAANDVTLLAYFDATYFKDDGRGLAPFLQNIVNNPSLVGNNVPFINLTLATVPASVALPAAATKGYLVIFTLSQNGFTSDSHAFVMYENAASHWLIMGNQKIAKVEVRPQESSAPGGNSSPSFCSGLNFNVKDQGAVGLDYAVVTGPALPVAGALLFKSINNDSLETAAGDVTTYNGSATIQASPGNCVFSSIYPLNDNQINAVTAALPATYVFTLYHHDSAKAANDRSADTVLATYHESIRSAPLLSTTLNAGLFASSVSATPTLLTAAKAAQVTSSTISWVAPAAGKMSTYDFYLCIEAGNDGPSCESADVSATATSTLLAIPQVAGAISANVTVSYIDSADRVYWYEPPIGTF